MSNDRLRIIELRAENFKPLKAVRFNPDAHFQPISGPNEAGKSSVLDLIWAVLGGKKASPERPIRDGTDHAEGFLDLGAIKVRRTWRGDKSSLYVTGAKGSPQQILDELFGATGATGLDCLAFTRMKREEQTATFRALTGLNLADLDAQRKKLYEERTEVNRSIKQQEGQLAALPEIEAPDEEQSLADLVAQRDAIQREITENRTTRETLTEDVVRLLDAVELVADLKRQLAEAEAALDDAADRVDLSQMLVSGLDADPEVGLIDQQIADVETTNRNVRAKKERAALIESLEANREESERLTGEIESIDAEAAARLAEASGRLPVPGLSLQDETVTLDGLPFSQASASRRIRVGLAIWTALNPRLRVALIHDGSLLDADALREVNAWAVEHDMQVFIELVARGEPVGIVIEDGEIVGSGPLTNGRAKEPAELPFGAQEE